MYFVILVLFCLLMIVVGGLLLRGLLEWLLGLILVFLLWFVYCLVLVFGCLFGFF